MQACYALTLALLLATGAAQSAEPLRHLESTTGRNQALLDAQYAALAAIPKLRVVEYDPRGGIKYAAGEFPVDLVVPDDRTLATAAARSIVRQLQPFLMTTGTEEFSVRGIKRRGNVVAITMTQSIAGMKVHGAMLGLESDWNPERKGKLRAITARILPDRSLPRSPSITARDAEMRALKTASDLPKPVYKIAPGLATELTYYLDDSETGYLAWRVSLVRPDPELGETPIVSEMFVNAQDGSPLGFFPGKVGAVPNRRFGRERRAAVEARRCWRSEGESATEQSTVTWSEAGIESELRALEEAGVLRQIAADRGYVLVPQRG
jgi:hypothetical protein